MELFNILTKFSLPKAKCLFIASITKRVVSWVPKQRKTEDFQKLGNIRKKSKLVGEKAYSSVLLQKWAIFNRSRKLCSRFSFLVSFAWFLHFVENILFMIIFINHFLFVTRPSLSQTLNSSFFESFIANMKCGSCGKGLIWTVSSKYYFSRLV